MKLFFILGNQLFPPKYLDRFKNDHLFFMSEDHELCTYEKHHKSKIALFFNAMRSFRDSLEQSKIRKWIVLSKLNQCLSLKRKHSKGKWPRSNRLKRRKRMDTPKCPNGLKSKTEPRFVVVVARKIIMFT